MKSYSMVAAAVLMAIAWLGLNPRCVAQQPATETNAGQASPGPAETAAQAAKPAEGQAVFYILAEFSHSLNAKKLKPGDVIKAEVTQDVLSHGRIIIPVESKLVGHVTEVKSHQTDDPESRLGIIFDKVLLKHRAEVDFRGVLHALSAPAQRTSRVDEPDQMLAPSLAGMNRSSSGLAPLGSTTTVGRNASNSGSQGASNSTVANMPLSNTVPISNVPSQGSDTTGAIPSKYSKPLISSGEQKPMSVGMPLGVFGLKGLSLTMGANGKTPGPVILSRVEDVKLESGTQVLLKVFDATVSQP